jgi:SRR1
VLSSKSEIEESPFFSTACASLQDSLRDACHGRVDQILCYGLGSFSSCLSARHQLGFLLALKAHLQVSQVDIYDPLFSSAESELLSEQFALSLIESNEEGKRKLRNSGCTLLFVPHCPKQLTNNFLWANWSQASLSSCLVLGNSITSVVNNPASLPETAKYLIQLTPFTKEIVLENTFRLSNVFNDLAFHTFRLTETPANFWSSEPAPVYPEDDTGKVICNGQ